MISNPTLQLTEEAKEILGAHQEIRDITKDSADEDITTGVRYEVKKIISGSSERVIEGIAGLIEKELRKVLGAENTDCKTFDCCRFVYNYTLAYRKETYEKEKK